ncbi:MAG: DUF5995 family protein, partial [Blastocatellia bacterium]
GRPIILQQLLVAMNAHINIDLGISSAETCPGDSIQQLKSDFMKINTVLSGVVPTLLGEIGSLSPDIGLLDTLAGKAEIDLIDLTVNGARDLAWDFAVRLASSPENARKQIIDERNWFVAALGKQILSPGLVLAEVFEIIRQRETTQIAEAIKTLDSGNPISIAVPAATEVKVASAGQLPNQVYYFDVGAGAWSGQFKFGITSWSKLWTSGMSLKNKLLATGMGVFQGLFGSASISSVLTAYPAKGEAGIATNDIRIFKWWMPLWHSFETYTLSPNGSGVGVDAQVQFGPISFLFKEHDVYPATVVDGGMRNLYEIRLLGTRFMGNYEVQPSRTEVHSTLLNDWSSSTESLFKNG